MITELYEVSRQHDDGRWTVKRDGAVIMGGFDDAAVAKKAARRLTQIGKGKRLKWQQARPEVFTATGRRGV
jgi:hypothetical protein